MPARHDASPDDIEVGSVFAALIRKLPKLIVLSALLGGLTYGVLMTMAPKYQSQAELQIEAKGASSSFADGKNGVSPDSLSVKMDKEAINTHVRALQSPDLIAAIADQMELKGKREFNSALGPLDSFDQVTRLVGIGGPRPGESERDRVLAALFKNLDVYSAKESRYIGIRVTSVDPELAADIANNIAETYRNSLATAATQEVDGQQKVLQGKIDKLMPEVAAAETEVERYRGEINVFKGGSQNTGLNEQQLSELTAELTKAKAARSEVEARANAAREMAKAGSADALPDVQRSPLIQNLVQQRVRIERQISELSATLLPGHPRMQQLNADLAGLKRQIAAEISKLVEGLEKEAKTAQSRENSIKTSLDEIKTRVVDNAPEEAKLRQLDASARAKRTELENLQSQLEANRKRLDTRAQPVEAQIMTRAAPASLPIFPKKGQNAALVAFATLLFGTFWTITRTLFEGSRGGLRTPPHRVEAEERGVPAPALAREPILETVREPVPTIAKASTVAAAKVPEPETEADGLAIPVEKAALRIIARSPDQGGFRALVTSDARGLEFASEGVALAKSLASFGRHVMLVDWSPSAAGMALTAGVKGAKGITDLLVRSAGFGDVVQRIPDSTVHIIANGAPLKDDEDIDPDQLNLVLDALDEAYDFIIVTGTHEDSRALFEAIQGRFDAGILVTDAPRPARGEGPGTFLGFEVSGIDVIRLQKAQAGAQIPVNRLARVVKRNNDEARIA